MFKKKSGFGGGSGGRKFGGKDFGARGPARRSGGFAERSFASPQMHRATCAECGDECQVPFRPNGSKPIFCSNCFKKDGDAPRGRAERGGFAGRPKFGESRVRETRPADNGRLEERLDELSMKLDRVLREIESLKENQD